MQVGAAAHDHASAALRRRGSRQRREAGLDQLARSVRRVRPAARRAGSAAPGALRARVRPTTRLARIVARLGQRAGRSGRAAAAARGSPPSRPGRPARPWPGSASSRTNSICLQHEVGLLRDHHAGAVAEAARAAGWPRSAGPRSCRRRRWPSICWAIWRALALVDRADLEHGVDEEPQALLRRRAAGRGVRRGDQPEILEIGHDVAHRGGRQADRRACATGRASRPARRSRDSARRACGKCPGCGR